jgi:PPOX class probable F420-dependent enzyme
MDRLTSETIIWLATTRADGRPHLSPIWFVWAADRVWICTSGRSVKAHALRRDPRVVFSLQDGTKPLVAEGIAHHHERPYPMVAREAFVARFDWDIAVDDDEGVYDALFEIEITRLVMGAPAS